MPFPIKKIFLVYISGGEMKKYILESNTTSYILHNVTRHAYAYIQLLLERNGVRVYTYFSTSIPLRCSLDIPPNVVDESFPDIVLYILFVACIIFLLCYILYHWCSRKHITPPYRPTLSSSSSSSVSSADEELSNVLKIMLVYPEGCAEVEKLVLYMREFILRPLCVQVLAPIFQDRRVAEENLPSVLISNFNDADCVVVLCLPTLSLMSEEQLQSYQFVLENCIHPELLHKNAGKRFIGVTTNRSSQIPTELTKKSYCLSSQLENFLSYVVYSKEPGLSTVHIKNIRNTVSSIDEHKKKINISIL